MTRPLGVAALLLGVLLASCTSGSSPDGSPPDGTPPVDRPASGPETAHARDGTTSPATPSAPSPTGGRRPATFDPAAAMDLVRELASGGPREAASPAFRRAATRVADQLRDLGYEVDRQSVPVPAGTSWGVPVGAGRTVNVVARPRGWAATTRYVLVGAHLDTVPQAPGAEDNASGVSVLLQLAGLAAESPPAVPVVFVAFGAEEPRGPGDDEHHFGSQAYLQETGGRDEPALRAMVSLDRVGAPGPVPVCTGGLSPRRVQRELLAAAQRVGVPARACENRTSDHWPFEKDGATVARVGGNDSPGYHSARDLPGTVSPRQLDRVGAVLWEWLRVQ